MQGAYTKHTSIFSDCSVHAVVDDSTSWYFGGALSSGVWGSHCVQFVLIMIIRMDHNHTCACVVKPSVGRRRSLHHTLTVWCWQWRKACDMRNLMFITCLPYNAFMMMRRRASHPHKHWCRFVTTLHTIRVHVRVCMCTWLYCPQSCRVGRAIYGQANA